MNGRTTNLLVLAALAVLAVATLALLPRAAAPINVRIADIGPLVSEGETTQIRSFYGFNDVEAGNGDPYRWTNGQGNWVFRNGTRLGEPLALSLRLCGCRAADQPLQNLTLQLNNAPVADLTAAAQTPGWRRYTVLVPPHPTPYSPDLLVELISDSVPNAAFGYPMGVALQSASLGAPHGVQQQAFGWEWALVFGLGISVVGLAALRHHDSRRAWLLVAGMVWALLLAQGFWYAPHQLPVAVFGAAILGAGLLAALLGRTVWQQVALLGVLALPLLLAQWLGGWILDDSYISFRYARNALLGHGLVFNPGERVEGYTNFLWTVLFVPVLAFTGEPAPVAHVLTLALALATVALLWWALRQPVGAVAALFAAALLAGNTTFVLYTARGSGMETALFTLLILAGVVAAAQSGRRTLFAAGALFGLAAMTRPEGVLVAVVCGSALLALRLRRGLRGALAGPLTLAAGALLVFGPYYGWRYSYYGYPLPNTFYAKVGGTGAQVFRGLQYALDFTAAQWPLVLLTVIGAGVALARAVLPGRFGAIQQRQIEHQHTSLAATPDTPSRSFFPQPTSDPSPLALFAGVVLVVYTAYIVAVGGDHFPSFRFFVPLVPLLAILAAQPLRALGGWRGGAVAALLLVLVGAQQVPVLWDSRTLRFGGAVYSENTVVEKNREIGLWLRDHAAPDTLVATGIAGALPFYSDLPVLDSLGLNDLHIAHLDVPTIGQGVAGSEKTDDGYVLSRRPGYIPYNSAGGVVDLPEFGALYQRIIVHGPEGRWMRLYRRADLPPLDVPYEIAP